MREIKRDTPPSIADIVITKIAITPHSFAISFIAIESIQPAYANGRMSVKEVRIPYNAPIKTG